MKLEHPEFEPWYREVGRLLVHFGTIEWATRKLLSRSDVLEALGIGRVPRNLVPRIDACEQYMLSELPRSSVTEQQITNVCEDARSFARDHRNPVGHGTTLSTIFVNESDDISAVEMRFHDSGAVDQSFTIDELRTLADRALAVSHAWVTMWLDFDRPD